MKIEKVQESTNFGTRYVPNGLKQNIKSLKRRMELDTIIIQSKEINKTVMVRGVEVNNGEAVFKDGKFLAKRNRKKQLIPYGENTAMIEFGKVRIITDDSGEILGHKKPLFTKWSSVFENADKYVTAALENYNNPKIVSKIFKKKESLTEYGKSQLQTEYNKIMNVFNSLNPFK